VNALPVASISAASTVICGAGNTISLSATGGATYQWSRNGTAISGATASTYAAALIGTYTATATSAFGCTAPATGSLVVTQLFAPKASFSYDSYCTNKAINFTNTSTVSTTGAVSYAWSDNNANTSSTTNARFTYPNVGNYSVKLKVQSNTCSNLADSVTVVVPVEAPRAAIRQTTLDVAINDNVQLQARNFGNQYAWSPSFGLSDPFISNPVINTTKEQDYLIAIGVPSGCTTVDTLLVRVHESNRVYVPNVFSPNGDGQNDKLYLIPVGISELKSFRIFNRWGKKMFETASITQGWDGTFNGQLQPIETYVWTVLAIDKNGKTIYQEGTVTLLR
jgi:gliding motility-associated-like protein